MLQQILIGTHKIKMLPKYRGTQGACSSVALAGFALPECPGSSPHVYPALEGLTAVVHRGLVSPLSRVRSFMCTPVTPAVPYLLLDLQDVQVSRGE